MTTHVRTSTPARPPGRRLWRARSLALLTVAWLILQVGGLFSPGLLEDVDSVYLQIAREMLARHDFVTPTIDGIRFFDKPPLMYWMAVGSMHLFGVHEWSARLPLALGMLALLVAVYALGVRLYAAVSPLGSPDRAGFYAALATATAIGPYLYTRFYIPDMLIALWMTLSIHLFLIARDRVTPTTNEDAFRQTRRQKPVILTQSQEPVILSDAKDPRIPSAVALRPEDSATLQPAPSGPTATVQPGPLLPMLGFGAVLALDVLTKGLIGLVFPLAFVLLFLVCTGELNLLRRLAPLPTAAAFLLLAAPWHILAAVRNPPIPMPPGLGLPARAGWAWFYLYNEHIARFLGRRIPHDYGQVPVPMFWLLLLLWLVPWTAFLLPALRTALGDLRKPRAATGRHPATLAFHAASTVAPRAREAALTTLLWPALILGFFTLSARQEYYHLPALPALALLVGALLAAADRHRADPQLHFGPAVELWSSPDRNPAGQARLWSAAFLVPMGSVIALACGYFAVTARAPQAGADLFSTLNSNPALYNLSLGHIFDLTGTAMGFFRGPLLAVTLGMLLLGPAQHLLLRIRQHTYAANLAVAAGMTISLLAAHAGLVRFYPTLGSKGLALAVNSVRQPGDLVAVDGELTSGSTLLFYTDEPVLLVNGRINGPWFGSFWPDAPHIFLSDAELHRLWTANHRVFLLTYQPMPRALDLARFGAVYTLSQAGGKTILTNRR